MLEDELMDKFIKKRYLCWIFVLCILAVISVGGMEKMAVYTDTEHNESMKTIIVDERSGNVYAGGRNKLYRFDKDLNLIEQIPIGPVLGNHSCQPENCTSNLLFKDGYARRMGSVYGLNRPYNNKSIPNPTPCGREYLGMCKIRNSEKGEVIFWWSSASIDSSAYVTIMDSSVTFTGRMNNGYGLYTATTYDDSDSKFFPASVSARKFLKSQPGKFSGWRGVKFHSKYLRSYKVDYVYGFEHKFFSYFVTTQRVNVDSDVIETRLARVCQRDRTFSSYMEVPLRCIKSGIDRNLARAALYITYESIIKQKHYPPEYADDMLFVSFSATVPHKGPEIDRSAGSVVCGFSMSEVDSAFLNETLDCFDGKANTHLLEHIVGAKVNCRKLTGVVPDGCGSPYNNYIEGRTPINGSALYETETQVTMLATLWQSERAVAILGTDDGHVMKVVSGQVLWSVPVSDPNDTQVYSIERSSALGPLSRDIYVLSGNKVAKIPIHSCSMYKSCNVCLNSEDPLNCGWCVSYCAHEDECDKLSQFQRNSCPPVIHSVSPAAGTVMGGTQLTINGENFGVQGRNYEIKVSLADQPCIVNLRLNDTIECTTRPVDMEISAPVVIDVRGSYMYWGLHRMHNFTVSTNSFFNFSYVVPKLYGVYPGYGPEAGGTTVTLYGEHLNVGSEQVVLLSNTPCEITRKSPDKLWCKTKSYEQPFLGYRKSNTSVELMLDGTMFLEAESLVNTESIEKGLVIEKQYEYRPNPDVEKIYPYVVTVSGLRNITVGGMNLNSIARPKIIVTVDTSDGKNMQFEKDCKIANDSGIEMTCQAPSIKDSGVDELSDGKPVVSDVTFFIDGNIAITDLKDKKFTLTYFPDPVYYPLDSADIVLDNELHELDFRGKYMNYVYKEPDMQVLVDGKMCPVTELDDDCLVCLLPSEFLDTSRLHSVEVIAGPLHYGLGTARFHREKGFPLVIAIVVPIVAVLIVGVVVMFIRKRYKMKALEQTHSSASAEGRENPIPQNMSPSGIIHDGVSVEETTPLQEIGVDPQILTLLETENLLIEKSDLNIYELIGQGHFGHVYKGRLFILEENPLDVAVKTSQNRPDGPSTDDFVREGLIMKDFQHPNVLNLIGICIETDGSPMVITPFMQNGDLLSFIRDENKDLILKDVIKFGIDIAAGMAYLSKIKYIHRDLAARNCMLDVNLTVKVADFGLSRDVYEHEYYKSENRTALPIKWMAIESMEKNRYTVKTDVWSYGVTLWELVTRGTNPYPDVPSWEMLAYLKSGRRLPQPISCPNALYSIMLSCWLKDPNLRPTFEQLGKKVRRIIEREPLNRNVDLNVTYVNVFTHSTVC